MGVHPEKLPSALEGVFLMGRKPKYSIEDTMIREIQEEIGLKVLKYKLLNIYSSPVHHNIYPNGDEVSCIDIVYYCYKFEDEIALQEDGVKNIQWFNKIIYRPTLDETQRNG